MPDTSTSSDLNRTGETTANSSASYNSTTTTPTRRLKNQININKNSNKASTKLTFTKYNGNEDPSGVYIDA